MLNKPQDIVIMFAIMAFVIVTIGFGIESIEEQGATTNDVSFFTNVEGEVTSTTGLKGTADEASNVIDPSDEALQSDNDEEGIIKQGLQSLNSISSTYSAVRNTATDGGSIIGLDSVYVNILMFTLIIIFFVLVYTWARGN